jgi:hypothetical protein
VQQGFRSCGGEHEIIERQLLEGGAHAPNTYRGDQLSKSLRTR